jgi:hypothetical protein
MNVLLTHSGIGHSTLTGTGKAAPVDAVAPATAKGSTSATRQCHTTAARRSEFAARQEQLNRQATHAQRSIAFLDHTLASLQELKTTLSGSVAKRSTDSTALETQLSRVQMQWQGRHVATGGALGPDLGFHDDGGAQQSFRIRAFDLNTLRKEQAEVLTVYPRGAGKPSVSLLVDGQQRSDREWARRIDHALAASGISAAVGDERELTFNAKENRWHELRDQLLIQGNGHRFPGGRPSRVAAEATAQAIDPASWQIGTASEKRSTLRQIVQAVDHIQLVRDGLNRLVQQTAAAVRFDSEALGASDARAVAASFDNVLEQTGDFQRFTTIGAAVRGLNEHRVRCVTA